MTQEKTKKIKPEDFSRYEKARIIGARGLQIAMNAPLLIKIKQEDLEKIKFDALKIAEIELNSGALPISVKKPYPKRKDEPLRKPSGKKIDTKEMEELEAQEEEEIAKEGEIMQLANPDDEGKESGSEEENLE